MSEFSFIRWIQSQQRSSASVLTPAGDDMAVLRWPADELLLAAVDQVIENVHYDPAIHTPFQVGQKVMNRNLSDCAAMACLPAAALACVALPKSRGQEYAQQLYLGMKSAADAFACPIIGGDTGSHQGPLVLSVSILGRSAGITPVLRSGANAGDYLYVTGPLGGSILGRHITFTPRIALARDLATRFRLTSMIDLSDGLSRDLPHLCEESHVGASVDAAAIPIHADAVALSQRDHVSPLEHALHDGEDHELLFTSPDLIPDVTCIGRILPGPAPTITITRDGTRSTLRPGGWEHQL